MALLFATGVAVGALWAYRSSQKPTIAAEDAERRLSDSTKAVLSKLKSSVQIDFYSLFGEDSPSSELSEFAGRVRHLLTVFENEANGRIKITPFVSWTEATTQNAKAVGVVPFGSGGDPAYLGLVVTQGEKKETLAQLRPEWEAALEFDLARAILRVATPPATPVSAADLALAEKASEEVQRSIPNLTSISLEEGKRILRQAAIEEYMAAVGEMEKEVKEAQQHVLKAEAEKSDSKRQAALDQLRKIQDLHAEKLSQIAARSQAQIEALQRMKQQ